MAIPSALLTWRVSGITVLDTSGRVQAVRDAITPPKNDS